MLLKSTEPYHFLFTAIHQLLGTGNNSQNKLYNIADGFFETWTQNMIVLRDKVREAEGEKFDWRSQKTHTH